jgi:RNA recognition motif-containing protein
MESNSCKVFVGNVPFQCEQNEFHECFENLTGFIRAEIVCKPGTTISRGFGFITFDSAENAKKILENNEIIFKDRTLRFTQYLNSDYQKHNTSDNEIKYITNSIPIIKNKNFLSVKNINKKMTRDELFNIFTKFGSVGRYFIVTDPDTGDTKSYAVVEMLNDAVYELLLMQREIKLDNENVLELSRWKTQKVYNMTKDKKITKYDLYKAFTAGRNVGMMEAFRI